MYIRSSHDYNRREEKRIWEHLPSIDPLRLMFWSWYEPRNFGDWVGPYLYEAITGVPPLYCPKERISQFGCFMTGGSILRHLSVDNAVIVWGTGIILKTDRPCRPKKILAVRGPLTAKRLNELGYDCPPIYGDPAILLPLFYGANPVNQSSCPIGIIPHFVDKDIWSSQENLIVIDPTQSVEKVVDQISSCRITFSSSLHGVIVSHAYGIPSVWIRTKNPIHGDDSKFYDYFQSTGIDAIPIVLGKL
jgi:pyruvyltransferase